MKKVNIKLQDKFGDLTVIDKDGTKRGERYWKCLCSCGKTISMSSFDVKYRLHCGDVSHKTREKSKMYQGYGEIHKSYWTSLKNSAKKRKLEFSITIEDAWNLFIKQNRLCKLTGLPLTFKSKSRLYDGTASLDRINPSRGYTIDNIQWVNKHINIMKSSWTEEEFVTFCKQIAYFNNRNCISELGPTYKDERGEIQMVVENGSFHSASIISSKAGAVRATHWHKCDYHFCYLLSGSMEYYERPLGSLEKPKLTIIKAGQLFFSPPCTEHEMVFLEDSVFLCLSSLSRESSNYESDTTRLTEKLKDIYDK